MKTTAIRISPQTSTIGAVRTENARRVVAGLVLLFSFGCGKSGDAGKAAPSATSSAKAPLAASSGMDAGGPSSPAAAATASAALKTASYSGTYSIAPAKMYIPNAKDYASVKQAKDDPTKHVGEGALTLQVDAEGHVTGTIDSGPASPALIDGSLVEEEIRGTIRRKSPSDEGLTGTFTGKISADSVEGKLALAEANAAVVRDGKLSLKKK
jgi:hypothetical protein